MTRILLIEDDATIADGIVKGLSQQNMMVDWFADAKLGEMAIHEGVFDAVLLDLTLPRGDGMTILANWRQQKIDTPVLIISARDQVQNRVDGLNQGADDYLVKPYEFVELLARMQALLRRSSHEVAPSNETSVLRYGDLVLDVEQHIALLNGQELELSNREWAILVPLVSYPNKIFSKANLEDKLYDFDSEVNSNTIEVYVHHLRAKLGKDFIRTIRGMGYRLGKLD